MVGRFFILLPFDLLIVEEELWPVVEGTVDDYLFRVQCPVFSVERPKPTDSVFGFALGGWKLNPPVFTDNLLVGGKRVAQVNVLSLDIIKPDFDRSGPADPEPELAFQIANHVLARLRVYARTPQIKPLVVGRDPWQLRYLTDDLRQLEEEPGKSRGRIGFTSTVGVVAVTPEAFQLVAGNSQRAEPYVWDDLLLDAYSHLPDVGGSIVMAYAALETFIGWALDVFQMEHPLPDGLWNWLGARDNWSKQPSVSEQLDTLLTVFTRRSLKLEEVSLAARGVSDVCGSRR